MCARIGRLRNHPKRQRGRERSFAGACPIQSLWGVATSEARKAALEVLKRMNVRGDLSKGALALSGGISRRCCSHGLVAGTALAAVGRADEGVDIGTKEEIHQLIRDISETRRVPILVVSSEEEEVMALADDVVILRNGSCSGELLATGDLTASCFGGLR